MRQDYDLGEALKESAERLGLPARRPYSLGVLLVHGVGEQQRGDTLTEVGDRLVAWLKRRVEESGESALPGELDVLEVVARQPSEDAIAAAHAVLRVTPPNRSGEPPANWVLAESFWADVFRPATFLELAEWGVLIGPWAAAAQVRSVTQRIEIGERVPPLLRLALLPIVSLIGLAMLLLAVIAGLVVTLLAIALVVLAFTSIPFLADFAQSAQRTLANGVGDAFVLTRSPMRFGAMSTQVRSDLQALRKSCSCVAVIAHSQGTAVAWHAIKYELTDADGESGASAPIRLFTTYGQAIRKLTFMLNLARGDATKGGRIAAVSGAGFVLVAFWLFLLAGLNPLVVLALVGAIASELVLMSRAAPVWDASGKDLVSDWEGVRRAAPGLEWLDLWASADPAPGGPLDLQAKGISSLKIRNLASSLLDHVVYWKNGAEFVAAVASRLFGLGGPATYAADLDDPGLVVSAMRRHARVMQLLAMRVVVVGAAAAGSLQAWLTPGFSSGVMLFLRDLHLPLVGSFFETPPEWAQSLAGVIAVLVAAVIMWAAFAAAWSALAGADEATYLRGIKLPLWNVRWYALSAILVALAVVVSLLLIVLGNPTLAVTYALATGLATLLALTVISSGGTTFASAEPPEKPMAAVIKITGSAQTSVAAVAAIAALLVAVPLVTALLWAPVLGWALAIEDLALSTVLAIEAVREYRIFRKAFAEQNDQLYLLRPLRA